MQTASRTVQPSIRCTHPSFRYTPPARTNVAETCRRNGWVEPDRAQQRSQFIALNLCASAEAIPPNEEPTV